MNKNLFAIAVVAVFVEALIMQQTAFTVSYIDTYSSASVFPALNNAHHAAGISNKTTPIAPALFDGHVSGIKVSVLQKGAKGMVLGASTGPVISNVAVDSISYSTARIQWDTDVASANTRLMYGTSSALPLAYATQIKNGGAQTVQGYTLGGLAPSTTYYFIPCSTSSSTNVETCGNESSFATASAPSNPYPTPALPNAPSLPAMPVINGQTFNVAADCSNLQSLINQAAALTGSANSQILIPATATCIGNYSLPSRSGSGWIVVRSAAPDSQLPPEGVRATTTYASVMPAISAFTNGDLNGLGGALYIPTTTSNWRFVGLQFTAQPGEHGPLVTMLYGQSTNMIFDRDIFYSNTGTGGDVGQTIYANASQTVIANSSITNIRPGSLAFGIDITAAQGINISNDYIDVPGISVFGEENAPAGIDAPQASDISITGNLFDWDTAYINNSATRQQLEFKAGNRILVSGNIFDNQWDGGITGGFSSPIVLTPRNGSSGTQAFNNYISDVTITNNIIENAPGGIWLTGTQNNLAVTDTPATKRVLIQNNLLYNISGFNATAGASGWGSPFFFSYALEDVTVNHNTAFDPRGNGPWVLYWDGGTGEGLQFTNNILGENFTNNYGGIGWGEDTSGQLPAPPAGADVSDAATAFNGFIKQLPNNDSNLKVTGNLIIPGVTDTTVQANYDDPTKAFSHASCTAYWQTLAGNTCAGSGSTVTANQVFNSVGFVGPLNTGSGFQLANNSPYKSEATDGTDPGVNMAALSAATANTWTGGASGIYAAPIITPTPTPVITPTPTPAPTPPVTIIPGSVYVSPASIDFGTEMISSSTSAQNIAFINSTGAAVTVSNIAVTGNFSISSNFCNDGVQANTHCNVYVVFTPTAVGTITGTLAFTESGVSGSPQVVALTGVGSNTISSPSPTPVSTTPSAVCGSAGSSLCVPTPTPAPALPPTPCATGISSCVASPAQVTATQFSSNALVNDSGTIYVIEGQSKLAFSSLNVFKGLGYNLRYVVKGDTSGYALSSYVLKSATMEHPWGSWLLHQGIVYYFTPEGFIPVPTWEVFLNNAGRNDYILPMSQGDQTDFRMDPPMTVMIIDDPRVMP